MLDLSRKDPLEQKGQIRAPGLRFGDDKRLELYAKHGCDAAHGINVAIYDYSAKLIHCMGRNDRL